MTNILLALLGAVIALMIGMFWYGRSTPMGKWHVSAMGFDNMSEEEKKKAMNTGKKQMPKLMAAQFVLSFLTALFTVYVVRTSIQNGVPSTIALLFPVTAWLGFYVPAVGVQHLWGNGDRKLAWKRFFSDSLANLVTILIIGLVASYFA